MWYKYLLNLILSMNPVTMKEGLIMCINRYNNQQSKRKLKKRAKVEAQLLIQGTTAPTVTASDMFLEDEKWTRPEKSESSTFKKEKPLKQGSTAGGKQKLSRGSKPLI